MADLVDQVYTFGSPRIGNEAFARYMNKCYPGRIFRLVHDCDMVPRLPLTASPHVIDRAVNSALNLWFSRTDQRRYDIPYDPRVGICCLLYDNGGLLECGDAEDVRTVSQIVANTIMTPIKGTWRFISSLRGMIYV